MESESQYYIHIACVCVCACVCVRACMCVRVWERERERGGELTPSAGEGLFLLVPLPKALRAARAASLAFLSLIFWASSCWSCKSPPTPEHQDNGLYRYTISKSIYWSRRHGMKIKQTSQYANKHWHAPTRVCLFWSPWRHKIWLAF